MTLVNALGFKARVGGLTAAVITGFIGALIGGALSSAAAAEPCYTKEQYQAEQALRLHTQLMVIGLTCQEADDKQTMITHYVDFTSQHKKLISESEHTMVEFFKAQHRGNATRQFDDFRTKLANDVSQQAGTSESALFCGAQVPVLEKAMHETDSDILNDVNDPAITRTTYYPVCTGKAMVTKAAVVTHTHHKGHTAKSSAAAPASATPSVTTGGAAVQP